MIWLSRLRKRSSGTSIGSEKPHHSLGLLERLDKAVEQNPVKTLIAEANAVLVMFVERIHDRPPDPKAGKIVDPSHPVRAER